MKFSFPHEDVLPVSVFPLKPKWMPPAFPSTVFAVDVSGSMSGKLGFVADAIAKALAALPNGAEVAAVAFGDEGETLLPMTRLTEHNRWLLVEQVRNARLAGGTNISSGISAALDLLPSGGRIICLSDGHDGSWFPYIRLRHALLWFDEGVPKELPAATSEQDVLIQCLTECAKGVTWGGSPSHGFGFDEVNRQSLTVVADMLREPQDDLVGKIVVKHKDDWSSNYLQCFTV